MHFLSDDGKLLLYLEANEKAYKRNKHIHHKKHVSEHTSLILPYVSNAQTCLYQRFSNLVAHYSKPFHKKNERYQSKSWALIFTKCALKFSSTVVKCEIFLSFCLGLGPYNFSLMINAFR